MDAQPDHGAFGELLGSTGGGVLIKPGCLDALCDAIEELKQNRQQRRDWWLKCERTIF